MMSRMRVRGLTLAGSAVAVALTGCTASTPSPTVTVSGTLGWTGGVRGPGTSPPYHVMPGKVMFAAYGETRSVTADAQGHFTARLPRGTYVVTGVSSHFIVNGVEATCRLADGPLDASRDRDGVLILCEGK